MSDIQSTKEKDHVGVVLSSKWQVMGYQKLGTYEKKKLV
jgi:hypothetical protein